MKKSNRKNNKKKNKKRNKVNLKHKDRLFCLIFGREENKKNLLELYNALNGTEYNDTKEIRIYTLEDAIYMRMKNDISFLFYGDLLMYEHQSSYNPNMPYREFKYCAQEFEKYIEENSYNVYGKTLIKLPTPRCFVFYNGEDEKEDRMEMRLSDAFINPVTGCDWTTTMININYGRNRELMDKCASLNEYSELVHKIREYGKSMSIENAVNKAVDESIAKNGVLASFLRGHRAEVCDMTIYEFNEQLHEKSLRAEERAEGLAEGRAKGLVEGQLKLLCKQIAEGRNTIKAAADDFGTSVPEFLAAVEAAGYELPKES